MARGVMPPPVAARRSINPATEEAFAEVAAADHADVNAAVESAHQAWESGWRDLAPGKRTEILFNVARVLRENLERIAQLETLHIGKPIADARDEAGLGARVFEYYAGAITKFCGQTIPVSRGGFDFTLREPMGVVACIVPWNFPFPIACWKAAPALAAGNCVVLKPASLSPLTALALGELAHAAGLPPGVLQVLPGSGSAIGDALVTHPLVRKVSFTGSTEIGRRIMELASRDLKRISLELGGKSPNIVFADADWQRAAEIIPHERICQHRAGLLCPQPGLRGTQHLRALREQVRRGDPEARGRRPHASRDAAWPDGFCRPARDGRGLPC